MSLNEWIRSGGTLLHNGSTPLAQNNFKALEVDRTDFTLRRSRLDLELSVIGAGTGTGVDAAFWSECLVAAALWWSSATTTPSVSSLPLSDITDEFVAWEKLYPTVNYLDATAAAIGVTWKGALGTIESFGQRRNPITQNGSLWIAWEISDPNNIINNTVSGVTYNLGATLLSNCLITNN